MPQNLDVVLGFSRGGYGGRLRPYGTFCWSTFSDAELLKSLYFIMIAVVPEVSVDCLYINQNQSINILFFMDNDKIPLFLGGSSFLLQLPLFYRKMKEIKTHLKETIYLFLLIWQTSQGQNIARGRF